MLLTNGQEDDYQATLANRLLWTSQSPAGEKADTWVLKAWDHSCDSPKGWGSWSKEAKLRQQPTSTRDSLRVRHQGYDTNAFHKLAAILNPECTQTYGIAHTRTFRNQGKWKALQLLSIVNNNGKFMQSSSLLLPKRVWSALWPMFFRWQSWFPASFCL